MGADVGIYSIDQIIDLDLYPIDQLDNPRLKQLMEKGRQALDEDGLFSLQGSRKRIALFCYDRNPGARFSQGYINELINYLPN